MNESACSRRTWQSTIGRCFRTFSPRKKRTDGGCWCGENVLKQRPIVLCQVRGLCLGLELDGPEYEVGRVDLTVRVRIAHTDDFALVLEYQHVAYPLQGAQLAVLRLERLQEAEHLRLRELGEREIVVRAVTHHAGAAGRGTMPVQSPRR